MRAYAAQTAKRSATETIAQGGGFVQVLDLPSIDNLNRPELLIQRGHLILFLRAPVVVAANARRTVEYRITQSGRDGTATIRGKIGSNNTTLLSEPPSEGGAIIPIYGGFRLEVQDWQMTVGTAVRFEAFYAAGELSPAPPHWNTALSIALTSDLVQNTAGPWVEIGTPPMGATQYRAIVPNLQQDDLALGPLEIEWNNADGTLAARDFVTATRPIGLAPQGFHARIRTGTGYGGSAQAPRLLWTWS